MGWFKLLTILIQFGPAIFKIVKEIVQLIRGIPDSKEADMELATLQRCLTCPSITRTIELNDQRSRLRRRFGLFDD